MFRIGPTERLAAAAALAAAVFAAAPATAATPQSRAEFVAAKRLAPTDLGGGYRWLVSENYRPIPAAAQQAGVRAFAGVGVEAPSGYFRTVLLAYSFFDDPRLARAYLDDLDSNLGTTPGDRLIVREFNFTLRDRQGAGRPLNLRCVVVEPHDDFSLNCHLFDAKTVMVMVLLMTPGPEPAQRRGGEVPIETAFRFGAEERIYDLVKAFVSLIPTE